MVTFTWKIGVEVELLAPQGHSRLDLAQAIADYYGGSVRYFFHPQAEFSKVPGKPIFQNLTLGFEVLHPQGHWLAQCVDDLTIQADLNRSQPPLPHWYRIVSDDSRWLQLVKRLANPHASLEQVLLPIAELFGTPLEFGEGGMVRVTDDNQSAIAMTVPLPGERERPCELITAPLVDDHLARLEALLSLAKTLRFTLPRESATHIHFDATSLASPLIVANLVNFLWQHGDHLKQLVKTNPNCRRLGKWPVALSQLIKSPGFTTLPWEEAKTRLAALKLSKYCDFNLNNLIQPLKDKHTFEVRILPGGLEGDKIIELAAVFETILRWAMGDGEAGLKKVPSKLTRFWG